MALVISGILLLPTAATTLGIVLVLVAVALLVED